MSSFIVKPDEPDQDGRILSVTPESAGWKYVGFEVYRLKAGSKLSRFTAENEACLVLLSGTADVLAGEEKFEGIGCQCLYLKGFRPMQYTYPLERPMR